MLKKLKTKLIIYIIFAIISIFILFGMKGNFGSTLYMDQLDYEVIVNEDGSMKVIEKWDIHIDHTNTIFKNFILSNKFGEIKDVTVKDLQTGKNLKQIDEEMYHVTTGCFYALNTSKYKFEIAWGTGMEEREGRKVYQIEYTVTDVITDYKDCQELYWMFLDKVNEIPVENVNMKITLPEGIANIDNLKVWGHGPLNGIIEKTSNNTVEVQLKNLSAEKMLEVRLVTTDKIFKDIDSTKIKNYRYLDRIIKEETKWANEANESSNGYKIFIAIVSVIYGIVILKQIRKIKEYMNLEKQKGDGIEKKDLKYFRDIPRENESTPAEANYLYNFEKGKYKGKEAQSNIVAATILNLCLKKYIKLETTKDEVFIQIVKDSSDLKHDEKAVYELLKEASNGKEKFEIKELNKYAKEHYSRYAEFIDEVYNCSRNELYKIQLLDKAQYKQYNKMEHADSNYTFIIGAVEFIIICFVLGSLIAKSTLVYMFGIGFQEGFIKLLLVLAPYIILKLIGFKKLSNLKSKIAILTQEGYDEQLQWKALANYMKEFSLLEEKEVPALVVWEKYLVFATAFGISKQVIEQMKAKYPEVFVEEYWQDENNQMHQIVKFATYNYSSTSFRVTPIDTLQTSVDRAYKTSLSEISAHSSSSGSGGGGGFSGGGGGRRRRRPEWAEDNK